MGSPYLIGKIVEAADKTPELKEPVGPTCLYLGERAKVFEGENVAKAVKEGWVDIPEGKKAADTGHMNKPQLAAALTEAGIDDHSGTNVEMSVRLAAATQGA